MRPNIGTAGWAIPRDIAEEFPPDGSSLERYASRFSVAEINSSFHRPHRVSTWERWRDSVPDDFRFSVKVPKTITHGAKLIDCSELVDGFLQQANVLGNKLAVLLVQLPPKLGMDSAIVSRFFRELAAASSAQLVCEPRNAAWFTDEADEMLRELRVARVAADPALCEAAGRPGGWQGLRYWRLHGSPRVYRSSYVDRMDCYAGLLRRAEDAPAWCIFDNTASSAATGDALALVRQLGGEEGLNR